MASSNNKITGFFKKVLAIANLCFSPPETGSSLVKKIFSNLKNLFFLIFLLFFFEKYISFTEFE